jgi:hypothetical protein
VTRAGRAPKPLPPRIQELLIALAKDGAVADGRINQIDARYRSILIEIDAKLRAEAERKPAP